MAHQPRAIVSRGLGLRERSTRQRVDRADRGLMAEQLLAAMDLERENARTFRELAAPDVLRLRPRAEPGRSLLVGLLVARREEARQRGILREREHPAIDEERLRLLERLQRAIGCQAAIVQPLLPELSKRRHPPQVKGMAENGPARSVSRADGRALGELRGVPCRVRSRSGDELAGHERSFKLERGLALRIG